MSEFGCSNGHTSSASEVIYAGGCWLCPRCLRLVTRIDGLSNSELRAEDEVPDDEDEEEGET